MRLNLCLWVSLACLARVCCLLYSVCKVGVAGGYERLHRFCYLVGSRATFLIDMVILGAIQDGITVIEDNSISPFE